MIDSGNVWTLVLIAMVVEHSGHLYVFFISQVYPICQIAREINTVQKLLWFDRVIHRFYARNVIVIHKLSTIKCY